MMHKFPISHRNEEITRQLILCSARPAGRQSRHTKWMQQNKTNASKARPTPSHHSTFTLKLSSPRWATALSKISKSRVKIEIENQTGVGWGGSVERTLSISWSEEFIIGRAPREQRERDPSGIGRDSGQPVRDSARLHDPTVALTGRWATPRWVSRSPFHGPQTGPSRRRLPAVVWASK